MAEYRKVSTALWSSPDFQALGPPPVCLSSLWTYLLMSPAMRMVPGLVLAGPAHIAEEIDPAMEVWTPRAVADLLDELEARGMLRWDRASRVVWLVNALGRPEHVPNANQVIGWRSVFDDVPRSCPFRAELWAAMVEAAGDKAAHLGDLSEGFENPSERVSEPSPNGSRTVSNSVSVSVTPTVAVAVEEDLRPGGSATRAPAPPPPGDPPPLVLEAPEGEPAPDVVVEVPCKGRQGRPYAVTRAELDAWAKAYPGVDVEAQARKAAGWARNRPAKQKAHRNIPRWLCDVWFAPELGKAPSPVRGGGRQLDLEARNRAVLDAWEREQAQSATGPPPVDELDFDGASAWVEAGDDERGAQAPERSATG